MALQHDIPADTRQIIIDSLQKGYDRFDPALFAADTDGVYPLLGAGKSQSVNAWAYPPTHMILSPREGREQADRDLGRKMLLRIIRQGRYLNPGDDAHGIWYWNFTDGDNPGPKDRNTPGFLGCALVRIWAMDPQHLSDWPADEFEEFKQAVRDSAEAGERLWVRIGYINPQCLDLFLGFAAADLLEDEIIREQTRKRLRTFKAFADYSQAFEEWLSPTYAGVNLTGLVPLAWYLPESEDKTMARELLEFTWQQIAAGAHAPTREISMPHSRAYGDIAVEHGACLYGWLHLAAPDIYTFEADRLPEHTGSLGWNTENGVLPFNGLSAPGLYIPLGLPETIRDDLRDTYPQPKQHRFQTEWIGGIGWTRDENLQPKDINKPGEPFPRFRQGTYYHTADYCLGSMNESFSWIQRRPCGAYWNDSQGAPTGIKVHAMFQAEEGAPFYVFNLIEWAAVQHENAILGAFHTAPVIPARPGETITSSLEIVGMGNFQPIKDPAVRLLGTHWNEGIAKGETELNIPGLWLGITPIGRGNWEQLDEQGLHFRFIEKGIEANIRLRQPAELEPRVNLTRTDSEIQCLSLYNQTNLQWDLENQPDILCPLSLQVQKTGENGSEPFTVEGNAQQFAINDTVKRMKWDAPASPSEITNRAWRGWVEGEEILP